MNDAAAGRTLADYARVIRRRWVYPATIIPGALLLAIFLAYALPATYRSFGVIMIESSTITSNVVQTTVQDVAGASSKNSDPGAYIDQQLDQVRRRVTKISELKELVAQADPYPDETDLTPEQKAELIADNTNIERVDPITLKPSGGSMAFSVYYDNPDPEIAQAIDKELVKRFIDYNQKTRAEQASANYDFLVQQARDMEGSMKTMEQQLAKFKGQFGASLPDQQARNLAGIDRVQRDLDSFESQIRSEEDKESTLALQLAQTSPSLMSAVSDWRTTLAKTKAELAEAEQKYTPEHPDVKRLRRQVQELAKMGAAGDSIKPQTADNPEYLLVKAQLDGVRNNLAALRSRSAKARGDLSQYEEHVSMSPGVEQQYIQLNRNYQESVGKYQDLQGKIKEAALAKQLEGESRGERFTLIRGSNEPDSPVFPNRLGMILIGLVLGGGIALGAAALVEASDPSVRGTDDLQDIMATTPVGAVPVIRNREDQRRFRLVWGTVSAAYAVAFVIVVITVISAV